jgi:anti-sigma factor RsiW
MKYEDSHPSDQQLLLEVEGELSAHEQEALRSHLEACWKCRARRREIENAIADFIRIHQQELNVKLPPVAGPRALLRAKLAELSATPPRSGWFFPARRLDWMLAAALSAIAALSLFLVHSFLRRQSIPLANAIAFSIPDSRLTPGAAILASRQAVCAQANVKNKAVSVALQQQVFKEYGIPEAAPQAYEVDYLVTPALGGADDVRNLWPHSYSAVWNARVKDDLEDRLREMVCDGRLDLAEAQREIAENWIVAYKKYFHTDQPLDEDRKQRPQ